MINIGIAGCGWISEHAHIPTLKKNENVNIKAVFDINIERANFFASKFAIKYVFNCFNQFLECGLDGIIIATPNHTHAFYSLEALKKGIGVLCEKPVALNTQDIRLIEEYSKKYGAIYVPGFVNRWRPDIQLIQNIICNGEIGNIKSINGAWIRKNGVPRPGTWFTNRELAGGGVLVDLGSHIIDICLMLIGDAKPEKYELVQSLCTYEKIGQSGAADWFGYQRINELPLDVENSVVAKINFDMDIEVCVKLSWLAPVEADYTFFKVVGEKGEIVLKTLFGFSMQRLWEKDVLVIKRGNEKREYSLDKRLNNTQNAFVKMLDYYITSLCKKETRVGYNDALKTVTAIQNLYKNSVMDEEQLALELTKKV